MPYILASQHPIIHMTCMVTSVIFYWREREDLVHIWDEEEQLKRAFIVTVINNGICLVLHILGNRLTNSMISSQLETDKTRYNFSYINQWVLAAKIICNFMSITFAQCVLLQLYDPNSHQG